MESIGSRAVEPMQLALQVIDNEILTIQDQENRNIAKKNKMTEQLVQEIKSEISLITRTGKILTTRVTEPYLPLVKA